MSSASALAMSASGDGNLPAHSARLLSSGISLVAAELRLQLEQARPRAMRLAVGVLAFITGIGFAALGATLAAVSPMLLEWASARALTLSIAVCAALALVGFAIGFWAWKRTELAAPGLEHRAEGVRP